MSVLCLDEKLSSRLYNDTVVENELIVVLSKEVTGVCFVRRTVIHHTISTVIEIEIVSGIRRDDR